MESVILRVDERPTGSTLVLATIQWFVFTLANVITVPIVVGHAFGLSAHDIGMFTERTFFVCGIIGLLQSIIGHRFPVIEGPAGMWWGVFIVLLQMSKDKHESLVSLLQQLEAGLIAGGIVFVLLGAFGLLSFVRRLFTPVVTGTFLILLALQVAKSLVEGVLGIGFRNQNTVSPAITLLSLVVLTLSIVLMFKGRGIIKSIAVLIGLMVGWILFAICGFVDAPKGHSAVFQLPDLLPFGAPQFNLGVCLTGVITAVILLSNLIASLQAFASAASETVTNKALNLGSLMTGIGTILSGLFGVVGIVPLSSSAGLVALTGIASRFPFVLASAAVTILGFFPWVGGWVATLPAPVGYGILFVVFAQMIGFGLRDYRQLRIDQRDVLVIGISILVGVGIFAVPATAWTALPAVMGYILDNGLIVGIVLVMLFEHVIFRRRKDVKLR